MLPIVASTSAALASARCASVVAAGAAAVASVAVGALAAPLHAASAAVVNVINRSFFMVDSPRRLVPDAAVAVVEGADVAELHALVRLGRVVAGEARF